MYVEVGKYNENVTTIFKLYRDRFLAKTTLVDVNSLNKYMIVFSPYMFSANVDNNKHKRLALYDMTMKIAAAEDEENLVCIGNGCIDDNSIVVVGMAPGFNNKNEIDGLSKPFKPSLYFANTSRILRLGLYDIIENVYFTNLSKVAQDRISMGENYIKYYEKYYDVFLEEMQIIKPRLILCLGKNTYEFLSAKNMPYKIYSFYHPAFFLYKHTDKDGIQYYKEQLKEHKINENSNIGCIS